MGRKYLRNNAHYSSGTEQRDEAIVRVEIKETRHGNLAVRSEVDGPSGLRGPTDAERKASELHNKILDRIDESAYSSGDVIADIRVPRSGDPWIDWNDEVVSAAGNDAHVAADGGLYRTKNDWVVIPMEEQHLPRVRKLWRERFGAEDEHIDKWLSDVPKDNRPTEGFVAASGGYVLGFGIPTAGGPDWIDSYLNHDAIEVDVWPTTGVIHMICVDEQYESRGIATELVRSQLRYLSANGVKGAIAVSWHRENHVDSRPLFEKLGFERAAVADNFYAEVADQDAIPCVDCDGLCECGATVYRRTLHTDSVRRDSGESA